MAFGDSLDLRFRITADGKEGAKEAERVRKGIDNISAALPPMASGFSTAAKAAGAAGLVIVVAIAAVDAAIRVTKALAQGMIDTATEIGTKSREAFEKFQKGIIAAGGTVTVLDRQISQTLLATLDRVKGATDRLFLDLIRVSGPALIVLLQKIGDLLIALGPIAEVTGRVLVINFIAAAAAVQTFLDVLKLIPNALKSGSFIEFLAVLALGVPQFQENVKRIKKEIEGLTFASAQFDEKGKGKAEAASKARIRILEIELQAAKRIFEEEADQAEGLAKARITTARELATALIASEEKLFKATKAVLEAERAEAEKGDLPEQQKAIKLAELRERELQALSDYKKKVIGILEDQGKAEDKAIRDELQRNQDAFDARAQLNREMRDLAIETRELQLEIDRVRLDQLQGNPLTRRRALDEQARLEVEAELLRRQRFLRSLDDQRADLLAKARTDQERLEIEQRFNELEEAEFRRHQSVIEAITEETKKAKERQDPFSARSILGEDFANVLAGGGSQLQAFGALFNGVFDDMARRALNVQNIVTAFTGALTSMLAQLILTGKGGAQAFKSLAAAIIAQVVVTSAIKSLQMIAKGVEYAAEATATFATGDIVGGTFWSIASGHAFKSAALYGAIAGGGAIAGVALAANSGGGGGGAGGGGQQQSQQPQDFTVNRGGQGGSLGVAFNESFAPMQATINQLNQTVQTLEKKISSMRPGDVVTVGSEQSPDAIGRAVVSEARRSAEFTNDFGRLLAGPV